MDLVDEHSLLLSLLNENAESFSKSLGNSAVTSNSTDLTSTQTSSTLSDTYLTYLQQLFTYDTERLYRETEHLRDEKSQLENDMLTLTFDHYGTFIRTAECSKNISNDFQLIEERLSKILLQLDDFSSCCSNFTKSTEQTNYLRKQNMYTLQKYSQLLEILEIPQLMDTCVRNDYYDEALELVTYVKRLERKFSSSTSTTTKSRTVKEKTPQPSATTIPIITQIIQDVRISLEYMLEQLQQQLQAQIQLPACLRIMGFIRRMDIFNELELRFVFLHSRTTYLNKRLQLINTNYQNDYYEHASKYIDETRNILFDIVTQYRALFSDDDTTLYVTFNRNEYIKETNLFRSWLIHRLNEFLHVLQIDLQHCAGSQYQRLESLLGQVMYFGASFSRYGFDFRPLFVRFFSNSAVTNFQNSISDANSIFEQIMHSYTFDQQQNQSPSLSTNDSTSTVITNPFIPPMILVSYTPLAFYCNTLLNAFNDLRLCCPLSIVKIIKDSLINSLYKISKLLFVYYNSEKVALTKLETEQFIDFLNIYVTILMPYINNCLQVLFPDQQLAKELGLSILDVSEKAKLNRLNIDYCMEPLKDILRNTTHKSETTILPSSSTPLPIHEESSNNAEDQVQSSEQLKDTENEEILLKEEEQSSDTNDKETVNEIAENL